MILLSTWVENGFTCALKQLNDGTHYYEVSREGYDGTDGRTITKTSAAEAVRKFLEDFRNND